MLAVYIGLRALPRQDWAVPIVVREAELGAPSYLPRIAIGQRSRMGLSLASDHLSHLTISLTPDFRPMASSPVSPEPSYS